MSRVTELLGALADYRPARQTLLSELGVSPSNRDPLGEFAEQFVAALVGGTMASNRVQRHWDVAVPDGSLIQVKTLANPTDRWINEHTVHRLPGVDWYALVLFENFAPVGVVAFPPDLTAVCGALGKRHPRQDEELQFTRRNWLAIRDDPDRFVCLGVRLWLEPGFAEAAAPDRSQVLD
jgi:hypothetical protein